MAEFSFIEISYDTSVVDTEQIETELTRLGFIHRTQHNSGDTGFWNLQSCIILLRKDDSRRSPCITGIGFNANDTDIANLKALYDSTTDF